jgi:predicted nucleotidyltransferase
MEAELINDLPPNVNRVVTEFVASARKAFDNDLRSVVLFGSGAEGKLRPTSDVNILIVLSAFEQARADELRESLRLAQAAIQMRAMFLLESEVRPAMSAFAVKFGDIIRRRRVLYGEDPFAGVSIARADSIIRLKQTLLNQTLRLREAYIARGLREEQLVATIADLAGPLRACAATLLDLEAQPAASPKEALNQVAASLPQSATRLDEVAQISEAREKRTLAPGSAGPILFHLIDLARLMRARVDALS